MADVVGHILHDPLSVEEYEVDHAKQSHEDLIGDTEEFYEKFFKDLPRFSPERLEFRQRFIREEYRETLTAIHTKNPEEIVDGLIDMMVVILGTLYEAGVDIGKAWHEVHVANMAKERNVNPSRFGSAGYDLTKPENWGRPVHTNNVGKFKDL